MYKIDVIYGKRIRQLYAVLFTVKYNNTIAAYIYRRRAEWWSDDDEGEMYDYIVDEKLYRNFRNCYSEIIAQSNMHPFSKRREKNTEHKAIREASDMPDISNIKDCFENYINSLLEEYSGTVEVLTDRLRWK